MKTRKAMYLNWFYILSTERFHLSDMRGLVLDSLGRAQCLRLLQLKWESHEEIALCCLPVQEPRPHCQNKTIGILRNPVFSFFFEVAGCPPWLSGIGRGLILAHITVSTFVLF